MVNLLIKPSSSLCNLRCRYCFYEDEANNRQQAAYGFMTEETLEQIIKKTLEYSTDGCTIAYQGGEPTLIGLEFFRKSIEFQNKYNTKGISIHNAIQTNGYRLGKEWAEFFAENNFLVGLSLDGTKDIHNAYRKNAAGEDTFFDIMDTKHLFDKYHVEYNILTVVNSRTAKKAKRVYEFYRKHNLHYLQFIPCMDPMAVADEAAKVKAAEDINEKAAGDLTGSMDFSLSAEDYGIFMSELFDLWYADLLQGKQPYIRSFENYIGILMGLPPEACDQSGVCGMQYVIEADGEVYPCDFYVLDDYKLGNLNTCSMEEVDRRRKEIRFIENSANKTNECRNCRYYPVCRGGCHRYRTIQKPDGMENSLCGGFKLFFDHSLDRMQEIVKVLKQK